MDREDLQRWRRYYLRQIKSYHEAGHKIYYTDETWLNSGYTKDFVWRDESIKSSDEAFCKGLSSGLVNPSGKGSRLIILHIGSDDGFVQGGDRIFELKKTGNYHEEMCGDYYEKWFREIMPLLEPNSVIVLNNASYHSRLLEKIPTSANKKCEIIEWLLAHGKQVDNRYLKVELLQFVKELRPAFEKKRIDEIA